MRRKDAAITALFILAACGDKQRRARETASMDRSVGLMKVAAPAAKMQNVSAPSATYWAAQKLIRTADVRIQVHDVPAALQLTDSIARRETSLVADSRTKQDPDGKRSADVVLRVPSERFSAVMQELRTLGAVQSDSVGTQDVTKEYADLDTRLAVKEQTVGRLRSLLDSRTAKLSDVLAVEQELGRAIEELEQMKGERRYYDQQIALSTIRVSLFERTPSQMAQIGQPISDALAGAMQVLGNSVGTIIYLFVAILPWIVVAMGTVWIVKPLRRRVLRRES